MTTGRIHSIQSMGTVDGPGVRYVVFLQGCHLRCAYCHNPDTWNQNTGIPMQPQELLAKIERYKPYFGDQGGLTLTGGEPLLQNAFVDEVFALCKQAGIHTVLDTSGMFLTPMALHAAQLADLVMLDIKMNTNALYRRYTGSSLDTALEFLNHLEQTGTDTWIRQVIVPGINDTEDSIRELCALIQPFSCVKRVELLPFRKLCLEKYERMGIPFLFDNFPQTPVGTVENLQALAQTILADTIK